MPEFPFLVTVTTEKTSGLIVSRDDQIEAITSALADAERDIDLSNMGARSDSEYSVDIFDVKPLDLKRLRAELAEYDDHVAAAELPTAELKKQLKAKTKELEGAAREITRLEALVETLKTERSGEPTTIYQQDGYDKDATRVYLKDGRYDSVVFVVGEGRWDDAFEIMHSGGQNGGMSADKGGVTVRFKGSGGVIMTPDSGNVVSIFPKKES